MEPITAVLTGIALVKQSVEFIKSNIETVNDIGEIVGAIDNLLDGEKQVQKERFSSGSIISSHKSAASDIIDAKLAQEAIAEMRTLISYRFGPSTWKEILDERARREQEHKELVAKERKIKLQKKQELQKVMTYLGLGVGFLLLIAASIFGYIELA
jgi:uncharacterized membrane protein